MSKTETSKDEVIKCIRHRRDELDIILGKGKGTYGQPDYVRDETWALWVGGRSELENLMRRFA